MSSVRLNAFAAAALIALAALALWGCSDTSGPDDEDDLPYPLRSSPDSLLAQFAWAYKNMDLEAYLDCLADSMLFYLQPSDVESDPDLEPGYWSKAVEDSIHAHMFGNLGWSANAIQLTLTTTSIETLRADAGCGRTTGWRYKEAVDLRVTMGGQWIYWATSPSLFVIEQDPDDVGPEGEPLYRIVEWRDLEPWQCDHSGVQSSWGSIKALYR